MDCGWSIHVSYGQQVQLRIHIFSIATKGKDYVSVYDGYTNKGRLLGQYGGKQSAPSIIESTENNFFILFHSDDKEDGSVGFNATYQTKGECLMNQLSCGFGEKDCYTLSQRCDDSWDCTEHGGDERGCGKCVRDKFLCAKHETQCYSEQEHCDGNNHCRNGRDEQKCTLTQCGPHNGTFLCNNKHCIFESWCCDNTDDCEDGSDEMNCSRPSTKVITAAVIGSLICGLLLVIALGCTCKLYALRLHEAHTSLRYSTPISRMTEEIFARRLAPPPYNEAMLTSRPYEEAYQELLQQEQMRQTRPARGRTRRHRNERRQGHSSGSNDPDRSDPGTEGDDVPLLDMTESRSNNDNIQDIPLSLSSDDDSDSTLDPSENSNVNITLATGMTAQWRRSMRGHKPPGSPTENPGEDSRDGASLETASASTDSVAISLDDENSKVEDDVPILSPDPSLLIEPQTQAMIAQDREGCDGESGESESVGLPEIESAIITAEVHADERPRLDR